MAEDETNAAHYRVNSASLSQLTGKTVVFPGKVISLNSQQAVLEAADGGKVTVQLNQEVPPHAKFLEVTGVAESGGVIQMISFSEWPDTVDMSLLNDFIQFQFDQQNQPLFAQ